MGEFETPSGFRRQRFDLRNGSVSSVTNNYFYISTNAWIFIQKMYRIMMSKKFKVDERWVLPDVWLKVSTGFSSSSVFSYSDLTEMIQFLET